MLRWTWQVVDAGYLPAAAGSVKGGKAVLTAIKDGRRHKTASDDPSSPAKP